MATHVFRGIQRLTRVLDVGPLTFTLRRASTSAQKFVTGPNGEKILLSPFGEITYPEISISDFVWKDSEKYSNQIALECGVSGQKYTYAQAKDACHYISRSLHNIGLKKGDVIALVGPNYPDIILSFLGSVTGGFIITTVNPQYTTEEMMRQLLKADAKAVIASAMVASVAYAAMKASLSPKTPFIVIDDKSNLIPEGSIYFQDLISRGKSLPPINVDISCDDVAILPFSSGTTGLPKGVMLTHRNLISNISMSDLCYEGVFQHATSTFQEVIPMILPFFHIYGLNAVALQNLTFGSKIITIPKFLPELFVNVIEKNKATVLYCVPPIILFMSVSSLIKKQHFEHFHLMMNGAAPLAESDVNRMYDKFGLDPDRLKFRQGYGLTESSPVAFVEIAQKYSSIGKNLPSCEARLVDIETKQDITTPKQTGELWFRGPHVMKGYLKDEAATKETLTEDGWLKTGDVAYFDADFSFFITDRLKELIKVKGFQVPPAELEALLRTHPDVEEAAVIGIPHARYGEVPKAFVIAKKDKKPTEDEIKNFVKGKVSDFKELKGGVTFVEEIPKNPSGKILRKKLKAT